MLDYNHLWNGEMPNYLTDSLKNPQFKDIENLIKDIQQIELVAKQEDEIKMLRECNESLIISEQTSRIECNRLRALIVKLQNK